MYTLQIKGGIHLVSAFHFDSY